MEFEQIVKRLDWLDEEHRKDKNTIDALTQRAVNLEGELKAANKKIKDLSAKMSKLSTTAARIEQFDSALAQHRSDIVNYVNSVEEKHQAQLPEIDKRYQVQFDGINKSLSEIRKVKEQVAEIRRDQKIRSVEETRLSKNTSELDVRLQALVKSIEVIQHTQKATEEPRRQDGKKLADLQGEIIASRKHLDEGREKDDLLSDSIRRIETRVNEILANEAERRHAQTNFIEAQALSQVEHERTWKGWEESLTAMRKQSETMDRNLQDWEITQHSLKRSQDAYDEIVQKFERRINEITEMQRLSEDRFRQEWATFQADDLKRWTSFNLAQEEVHKEYRSGDLKIGERLTSLEDLTQTQQDVLQQTNDANEQLLQGMLAQFHELLSAYERIQSTK